MHARILILDEFAELYKSMLEPYDCEVTATTSEHEALSQLMNEKIDLLFLSSTPSRNRLGDDFVAEFRSCKDTDTLVLMAEGKDGRNGIVRAPVRAGRANGYIISPFHPDDLVKMIEKLLAGASTQQAPGDEGFVRCECREFGWNVAFEHPAFWPARVLKRDINAFGPWHHSLKAAAGIEVSRHLSAHPESQYVLQEILNNRYSDYRQMRQVTPEHQVQIAGLQGQEAEYLWKTKRSYGHCSGRVIITAVSHHEVVYTLMLQAANEDFDDYRAVHSHLVKKFEFLSPSE